MDCQSIQDQFTGYHDEELADDIAETIGRHLEDCPVCAGEWHYFQLTVGLLHGIEQIPAPVDIITGIHEKLERKNFLQRFLQWFRHANPTMSVQAAAATIVIAFAAMFLYKGVIVDSRNAAPAINNPALITAQNDSPYKPGPTANQTNLSNLTPGPMEKFPADNFVRYPGILQTSITPRGASAANVSLASTALGKKPSVLDANPVDMYYDNFVDRVLGVAREHYTAPDLYMSVIPKDRDSKTILYHTLLSQSAWKTRVYDNNILLLTMRFDQLTKLDQLFRQHSLTSSGWLDNFSPEPGREYAVVAVQLK